jgi:hypothetical protein
MTRRRSSGPHKKQLRGVISNSKDVSLVKAKLKLLLTITQNIANNLLKADDNDLLARNIDKLINRTCVLLATCCQHICEIDLEIDKL